MGILPEELPLVLTIFLAFGAWRIAQQRVLTRRIPALEMLGATTVLCTDKTGTLTENRMSVRALVTAAGALEISELEPQDFPEPFHELLEFAALANQEDPFDPMERAIRDSAQRLLAGSGHLHADWQMIGEYPLSRELLSVSHVWSPAERSSMIVAAKGAPEAIADLCHLSGAQRRELEGTVAPLASRGLRVIGVARAVLPSGPLPPLQHDFDFEYVGLLALQDPLRTGVRQALRECGEAGIRVAMITGDYPQTALSIAREAGLCTDGGALGGAQIASMTPQELARRLRTADVFSRVAPEQKLQLVEAFKASGEIVAMTGDGVNDAPALRSAHVGIAMGQRGTDVAREAAALVLLDDDFPSIVKAIRLGRRIFENLRHAVAFLIAVHVPIIGLSLLPVLLGWRLVLLPAHILVLELIIDPACSLVLEAEAGHPDLMRRPPRPAGTPLYDRATFLLGLLQGLVIFGVALCAHEFAMLMRSGPDAARATTFIALVVADVGLILSSRSRSRSLTALLREPNVVLWVLTAFVAAFLALVVTIPAAAALFSFGRPSALLLAVGVAAGVLAAGLLDAVKLSRAARSGAVTRPPPAS
jgi:Ca2+-transporting ATPase